MKTTLDVASILRAIFDALDAIVEDEQRRTGSVEGQHAATLTRRARLQLVDQAAMQALREVS